MHMSGIHLFNRQYLYVSATIERHCLIAQQVQRCVLSGRAPTPLALGSGLFSFRPAINWRLQSQRTDSFLASTFVSAAALML
jgi:hypothetical protein